MLALIIFIPKINFEIISNQNINKYYNHNEMFT